MKRAILMAGSIAFVAACSNPQASAGNNFAATSSGRIKPVAASGDAVPGTSPAAAGSAASASGTAGAEREITIPAGTVLPIDLETSVGSDISRAEQPVQGRLRHAVMLHGVQVLAAGTPVSGHVTTAQRPGKVKGRGLIAMRFTELDTPGRGTTRISSATIGRLAPATKQKDALQILAPATGGAVIGRIVGGKSGAAKGAVIGGAAGTGYVLSTRGKEVRLGKGADLSVRLTAPVTVRISS